MTHTVDAVSAFHKWHIAKRPHNIILNRGEGIKVQDADSFDIVAFYVDFHSLFAENIFAHPHLPLFFIHVELFKWIGGTPYAVVGDDLYGSVFSPFSSMCMAGITATVWSEFCALKYQPLKYSFMGMLTPSAINRYSLPNLKSNIRFLFDHMLAKITISL